MAYSIACKDTGTDCPGTFATETTEELMVHAEMHLIAAHPETKLDDAMRQELKGIVKQS